MEATVVQAKNDYLAGIRHMRKYNGKILTDEELNHGSIRLCETMKNYISAKQYIKDIYPERIHSEIFEHLNSVAEKKGA